MSEKNINWGEIGRELDARTKAPAEREGEDLWYRIHRGGVWGSLSNAASAIGFTTSYLSIGLKTVKYIRPEQARAAIKFFNLPNDYYVRASELPKSDIGQRDERPDAGIEGSERLAKIEAEIAVMNRLFLGLLAKVDDIADFMKKGGMVLLLLSSFGLSAQDRANSVQVSAISEFWQGSELRREHANAGVGLSFGGSQMVGRSPVSVAAWFGGRYGRDFSAATFTLTPRIRLARWLYIGKPFLGAVPLGSGAEGYEWGQGLEVLFHARAFDVSLQRVKKEPGRCGCVVPRTAIWSIGLILGRGK